MSNRDVRPGRPGLWQPPAALC